MRHHQRLAVIVMLLSSAESLATRTQAVESRKPAGVGLGGQPTLSSAALYGTGLSAERLHPVVNLSRTIPQGGSDVFVISPTMAGTQPDYLLTLTGEAGNAVKAYCQPADAGTPGPGNYSWSSSVDVGQSSVFVARDDPEYLRAAARLGNAVILCSIVCVGPPQAVSYSLVLEEDLGRRETTSAERVALDWIFFSCCRNQGTCERWHAMNARFRARPFTDFCYMPGSLCNAAGQLLRLDMSGFGLTCPFPGIALANMRALRQLDLSGNALQGHVGDVTRALQTNPLVELRLAGNRLHGAFGDSDEQELCQFVWQSLTVLDLGDNSISGPLPPCLLQSGSFLTELSIGGNSLGGSFPDVFPGDSQLRVLNVSSTGITGSLPAALSNAPLVQLDVSHNTLAGPLPAIWYFEWLEAADFSSNQLTGELGDALLGAAPSLRELRAAHNRFTGLASEFPPGLQVLDIAGNLVQGRIPPELTSHQSLEELQIQGNFLSGQLPGGSEDAPPFPALRALNACDNLLSGSIPAGLQASGLFQQHRTKTGKSSPRLTLDLSSNQLSGTVPAFFESYNVPYQLAEGVRLAENNFDCPLSPSLGYISNISCGIQHPPKWLPPSSFFQLVLHLQADRRKWEIQFVTILVTAIVVLLVLGFLLVPRRYCCTCCRHSRLYARLNLWAEPLPPIHKATEHRSENGDVISKTR